MPDNFEKMVKLAEEFFGMKGDPEQLSVDESVIASLRNIHPATMAEERDENGPVAWVLLIPTSRQMMERFLARTLSERDLLGELSAGETYEAIYMCSALVLPECRRKGVARRLAVGSVRRLARDYPIQWLYYWSFSPEGESLAAAVAHDCGLPLRMRPPAPHAGRTARKL